MKKGCFYFAITIFTVIVALGYYAYKQNKSVISKFGKEKIISFSINELKNKIQKNIELPYKDSLKILLDDYSRKVKTENVDSLWDNFQILAKKLRFIIEDNKVDSLDFVKLKKIVKGNEKPANN